MTYHTSHHQPPRLVLPPTDAKPVGMPCEDDLGALMMRASVGERAARSKIDGTGKGGGMQVKSQIVQERLKRHTWQIITYLEQNPRSHMKNISDGLGINWSHVKDAMPNVKRNAKIVASACQKAGRRVTFYSIEGYND